MKTLLLLFLLAICYMNAFSQTADYFEKRGLKELKNADFRESIKNFSKAIAINPKDTDAYAWRGFAKYNLHSYQMQYWIIQRRFG